MTEDNKLFTIKTHASWQTFKKPNHGRFALWCKTRVFESFFFNKTCWRRCLFNFYVVWSKIFFESALEQKLAADIAPLDDRTSLEYIVMGRTPVLRSTDPQALLLFCLFSFEIFHRRWVAFEDTSTIGKNVDLVFLRRHFVIPRCDRYTFILLLFFPYLKMHRVATSSMFMPASGSNRIFSLLGCRSTFPYRFIWREPYGVVWILTWFAGRESNPC